MMNLLVSKRSWLLAPVVYLLSLALLALVWTAMEPQALRAAFDADGRSFVEVLGIPLYALIVPTVWLCCPFAGSAKRKALLCSAVSCVAVMAIVKQLDIHLAVMQSLYPDVVANFKGTPFKMRFLTRGGIPLSAKLLCVSYFVLFFGVFAALLAARARATAFALCRYRYSMLVFLPILYTHLAVSTTLPIWVPASFSVLGVTPQTILQMLCTSVTTLRN